MATPRTERKPRLAYAANRRLGVRYRIRVEIQEEE